MSQPSSSDFSFPPSHRLHYSWEFRRFFNHSEAIRLRECILFRLPNNAGHFRLGVTVKAKCNSVERNRAKRTVREFFRLHAESFGAYDYNVVIPRVKKIDFRYVSRLRNELTIRFGGRGSGREITPGAT